MKPRGLLMIEHRLIEKMLALIDLEIKKSLNESKIDSLFIDSAVDFIRTYADRTHHGKEEDILFKELEKKNISAPDMKMMLELIEDHKKARKTVRELVESNEKYLKGAKDEFDIIIQKLKWLIEFYPRHIKKEDASFFPDTEKYFSQAELDILLKKYEDFDRNMIHEKYSNLISQLKERFL